MIKTFFIRYYKPLREKENSLYTIKKFVGFGNVYELNINTRLLKIYKVTNKNSSQIKFIKKILKYQVKVKDLIQEVLDNKDTYNRFVYTIDYPNKIK